MIQENGNRIDESVISDVVLNKMSRPVDRKTLKLEKDMVFWEDAESTESEESGYGSEVENEIDGVKLANLKKWLNSDTLVGKMIRYLYDNEETVSFRELKEGINYEKSDDEFLSNIKSGHSLKSQYGKLWNYKNDKIKLNNNIREYIDKI